MIQFNKHYVEVFGKVNSNPAGTQTLDDIIRQFSFGCNAIHPNTTPGKCYFESKTHFDKMMFQIMLKHYLKQQDLGASKCAMEL